MDKVKEALLLKNDYPEAFSNEDNTLKNLGTLQEAEVAFKEKALSMGVELHIAGEFDLASQMYSSVIKFDPNHADANHNMGLLKLDTGHDLEALPYFQTALQADTSVAQFWLSYIKALIQLDREEEAARILSLAKESGAVGEEFLELQQQLDEPSLEVEAVKSEVDTLSQPKSNILDTLKLDKALRLAKNNVKEGSHEEAKLIYQDILEKFPINKKAQQGLAALNKPPQETINQLINLYNQGQLPAAVDRAKILTQQYPKAFIVWNILGAANKELGRLGEASEAFQKVVELNPTYADGYNNMGVALEEQGKLEKAIEAYNEALSIKPDYAEAHRNLSSSMNYKPDDTQVALVGQMIKRSDLKDGDRCHLHYTYAKMNEDLGDLAAAFDNYVAGAKLRKKCSRMISNKINEHSIK